MSRNKILLTANVLTVLLCGRLPAQTVTGTVIEVGTRTAVDAALVTLLTERGDSIAAVLTDRGSFRLVAPQPGRYRLNVLRIGFVNTQTEPLELSTGYEVTVEVVLGVEAVPLEPLRVTSRAAVPLHAQLADVEERRRQGFGRFLMRAQIENAGSTLQELLGALPGVKVRDTGEGDLVVQLRAGMASLGGDGRSPDPRIQAFLAHSKCPVKLYVDGMPWVRGHEFDPRNEIGVQQAIDRTSEFFAIPPSIIEAIEVYSGPAATPPIFGGSDAQCGTIAVWTRRTIR